MEAWKEIEARWVEGTVFEGFNSENGEVLMGELDGKSGLAPMEMLLAGLAGCTGIDVVLILGKKRQIPEDFKVKVRAKRADKHPKVYTEIEIEYLFWGDNLTDKAIQQAILLSEDKYCSVSAMLSKTAKISSSYQIMPITEEKK
ncbi:MAG: OsmC family protein [Chloroflexota bacterium]|nr:OsmC family protein [Chloroflexota bacterium]